MMRTVKLGIIRPTASAASRSEATWKSRRGFTLLEVLTATLIMGMLTMSTVVMMISSIRCYDSASTRTYTDVDAVVAMQAIVNDVREAKTVSILDSGATLRVTPPETTPEGYYDRFTASTNYVDYYLSNSSGNRGVTGVWLWRVTNQDERKVVRKDVTSMLFETDTARSVKITIVTRNNGSSGTKQTELTQRVVYLRNY